jgi:DNA mismatch repair ATPase MutS
MKACLMYRDRDFDVKQLPPPQAQLLVQDLELGALFAAMSNDDPAIGEVVEKAVLASVSDLATIQYRQDILRDCRAHEPIVREIYALMAATLETQKKSYYLSSGRYPAGILSSSITVLESLVDVLRKLRTIAEQHSATFASDGFQRLFAMLCEELSDDYFAAIRDHLWRLKFKRGVLISAQLGEGTKGVNYVLCKDDAPEQTWVSELLEMITGWFGRRAAPAYSFKIPPQDDSRARELALLKDRGVNLVANALAQATDHVLSFFGVLRTELAFYIGCLNLHRRLTSQGQPVCFPSPVAAGERQQSAVGLYDVGLALNSTRPVVVGNELAAEGKSLILVTGANQGGKSTFLRSVGVAQLMMQCGMFVAATAFTANVCERIFTHYRRAEDAAMNSGKFDEELSRMSDIVDGVLPNSLVLFNESFAATNEREGSEIARQIVSALVERRVKVVFVTHQYDFAHGVLGWDPAPVLFLRAERRPDGARTFKIVEGEPLETSYGADLYARIFPAAL